MTNVTDTRDKLHRFSFSPRNQCVPRSVQVTQFLDTVRGKRKEHLFGPVAFEVTEKNWKGTLSGVYSASNALRLNSTQLRTALNSATICMSLRLQTMIHF